MSLISTLTDGTIPIGDVDGDVYLTTRTETVADIAVELVKPSGEVEMSTRTDETGSFAFHQVPPGRWQVRAHASARSGNVEIDMTAGDTVAVVLQLVTVDTTVTGVRLTPSTSQHVHVGDQVAFSADGIDAAGNTLPNLSTSWAVEGHIGTISPAGLFEATRAGAGIVVAQYGDLRATVQVIVSPAPGPNNTAPLDN